MNLDAVGYNGLEAEVTAGEATLLGYDLARGPAGMPRITVQREDGCVWVAEVGRDAEPWSLTDCDLFYRLTERENHWLGGYHVDREKLHQYIEAQLVLAEAEEVLSMRGGGR